MLFVSSKVLLTSLGWKFKKYIGIIEIWENLRRYFEWFQLQKTFPKPDEKFIRIRNILHETQPNLLRLLS